jgi:hypothetical protein
MFRWRRLLTLLPTLATLTVMLTGNVQAALLDIGPPVPVVIGSTAPNMGHGFPAWFRDSNRVPLQLCVELVPGCLLLAADLPNPAEPPRFPDNLPGEIFYYSAEALIGNQLLFSGIEMNFVDNGDGTYEQVGFARVRIRIDSTVAGDYVVTTPWKQYFFTVDQATIDANGGIRVINATEDIGLGANGVFTGILGGSVDPFAYSQGAPFVTANGSFLGDGTPRPLLGSKFTDPNTGQPANIFRIEGPPGFATVSTNLFSVTGKLYDIAPVPTPLTVDRVIYSRNAQGMQYSVFSTTQPVSNQVNSGLPFPNNFALTGALSALEVTGTDIPTLPMVTNNPEDGKFFATSGVVTAPGTMPASVTVTNTADTPPTVIQASFVDEVVISEAVYTPETRTLRVTAASGDQVALPGLEVRFPNEIVPAGIITSGQTSVTVTFPLVLGGKTYEIPPPFVIVVSSLGGTSIEPVSVAIPLSAPVAVDDTATVAANGFTFISVLGNDTGAITPSTVAVTAPDGGTAVANPDGTVTYTAPAVAGTYTFTYTVSGPGGVSNSATVTVTVNPPAPAQAVTLFSNVASPQLSGTSVTFSATATGGSGSYEYQYWLKDTSGVYTLVQPFSSTTTWAWNTTGLPQGAYSIAVQAKSVGSTPPNGFDAESVTNYFIIASSGIITPATAVAVSASPTSPQTAGATITFTGLASGGSGFYEYQFWLKDTTGVYTLVQPFTTIQNWLWDTTGMTPGTYTVAVQARSIGTSPGGFNVENTITFDVQ